MPRNITRQMLRVLQSDHLAPVGLLDIRLAGSSEESSLRLTDAGKEITFGGKVYLPMAMARSELQELLSMTSGDQSAMTLTLGNVDGRLATLLADTELDGAQVTYRFHDRRLLEQYPSRTRDAIILFTGEIRDSVLSRESLIINVVGVLGVIDGLSIPRRAYASKCGVPYGSPSCGVDLTASPNSVELVILSGSDRQSIRVSSVDLDPLHGSETPSDFWQNGYVTFRDGVNVLQSRPIAKIKTGGERRIFLRSPFLSNPSPGDTIVLRRGCPKTKLACADRQGNTLNFRGHEEVPFEVKSVIERGY